MRSTSNSKDAIRLAADGLQAESTASSAGGARPGQATRTSGWSAAPWTGRATETRRPCGSSTCAIRTWCSHTCARSSATSTRRGHHADRVLAARDQAAALQAGEAPFGTLDRAGRPQRGDRPHARPAFVPCEDVRDPTPRARTSPGAARSASPGAGDAARGPAHGGGAAFRGGHERRRDRRAARALRARRTRAPAQGPAADAERAHPPRRGADRARRRVMVRFRSVRSERSGVQVMVLVDDFDATDGQSCGRAARARHYVSGDRAHRPSEQGAVRFRASAGRRWT